VLTEAIRLVVTLALTAAGYAFGSSNPALFDASPETATVLGAVLGAGVGYVVGGLAGRFTRRSLAHAPDVVSRATGPQLFAGTFGLIAGLLVGAVMAVPAIILLPPVVGWPGGALLVIVLAAAGSSIFSARAEDLLAAAGLSRRRGRPAEAQETPSEGAYVIDSSAAIDGRVLDLARAGLMRGDVWVPGFVLDELQGIADSGQKERRRRGRRGLDVLDALADLTGIELRSDERTFPEFPEVDAKLLGVCVEADATLVTTDHNLARAAGLRGVSVLNPHALGESMRRVPLTGEAMDLHIEKTGSEPGQGVGYLDDGTMVVVEGGASHVGEKVAVEVTSVMRTAIGRMVFAKMGA
jgi:uncharacterized protein YacL